MRREVRLVPRRFLPDRALDLLERAAARGGDVGEGAAREAQRRDLGRDRPDREDRRGRRRRGRGPART